LILTKSGFYRHVFVMKVPNIKMITKILPVEAALIREDKQTDKQTNKQTNMTKLICAFGDLSKRA
jgi:hypothetical protein